MNSTSAMFSTTIFNTSTLSPPYQLPPYIGFIGIAVSSIGFGINFLPVKQYETGDGMFFQWIVTNAIFLCSFVVHAILKFPKFQPLVVVGGLLWATGNVCVVPIVRLIGLGLGLLLWSSANLIIGWASARFGWFGIIPQEPNNFAMNYVGFALTAISPFIYSLVKTEISQEIVVNIDETVDTELILNNEPNNMDISTKGNENKMKSKLIAIALSLFSGTLYGLMFIPLTFVKNWYPGASQNDVDHIFAQCTGIYLAGTIYFIIYCFYRRNKPILYPQCILPGLVSGFIWFIAYVAFFFANQALSPAISQPILSALPGMISILINTVVFKEIRGLRNYLMISIAIVITIVGVVLTALSKLI